MPPITKHSYEQKAHKVDHIHQLARQHSKFHLKVDHQQKQNTNIHNYTKRK